VRDALCARFDVPLGAPPGTSLAHLVRSFALVFLESAV